MKGPTTLVRRHLPLPKILAQPLRQPVTTRRSRSFRHNFGSPFPDVSRVGITCVPEKPKAQSFQYPRRWVSHWKRQRSQRGRRIRGASDSNQLAGSLRRVSPALVPGQREVGNFHQPVVRGANERAAANACAGITRHVAYPGRVKTDALIQLGTLKAGDSELLWKRFNGLNRQTLAITSNQCEHVVDLELRGRFNLNEANVSNQPHAKFARAAVPRS
jgi:hypothetical protein